MQSVNKPGAYCMIVAACTTPIVEASIGLDSMERYPTRCCIHNDNSIGNLSTRVLTMTAGTPPFPDVHRFRSSHWTRGVVMHNTCFVHSDILWSVLRNEREVREVDRMELIKGILTLGRISSPLFLRKKRV